MKFVEIPWKEVEAQDLDEIWIQREVDGEMLMLKRGTSKDKLFSAMPNGKENGWAYFVFLETIGLRFYIKKEPRKVTIELPDCAPDFAPGSDVQITSFNDPCYYKAKVSA